MNSFWDFLSSVSSRDFDDVYTNARITQLEEALRLQGVLPTIRQGMYGGKQRTFVAAVVRFIDEDEVTAIPTRNAQEWNTNGHSSIYLDYLDSMAKLDLIKYNRADKTIRPNASLASLAKITNAKAIAA